MIENRIVPNINIFSDLSSSMPIDEFSQKGFGISNVSEGGDFKTILSGLVSNINNDMEKPDQLLSAQMSGNPNVDIHDVTTAMAKAEIGVTIATQMTSKVIAAYNAVMNISI
ncbi:MAG: flagellar hook-basal body complex protein FliE [Candidatus Avigastranaerophilus sp.]